MNSNLNVVSVKTPLTSYVLIVVLIGCLIITSVVAFITFIYLFIESIISKGVFEFAYVLIAILVLIPFTFIMISFKDFRKFFITDTISKNGIVYTGNNYYWKDVSTIYANKELDYIIILFNGLHGPGNWAGIIFWKKYIEPSTEELLNIAREINVQINEDKILTSSELMKIRDERIAKSNS